MHHPKLWLAKNVTTPKLFSSDLSQKESAINLQPRKNKSRGDVWDQINLKEMLNCEHKKLHQGRSRFQNIHVLEAKEIRMFLDDQLQFSSLDERIYHEAFVHIPMALTKSRNRVLILGGGDGLALREVLKYADVEHVDLIDIDPEIINIAQNVPEIVSLNESSYFDNRVNAYAEDARTFLARNSAIYDLIIVDFPDPTDAELASLYSVELFQLLGKYLEHDGMIVCQANSPEDTPTVFWSIGLTMENANFHTKAYHTIVPSFGDWGFQLAAKTPISTKLRKITVPSRTLPSNVSSLFQFNNMVSSYKQKAIVNHGKKPQLHELFQEEIAKWL